MKLLPVILAVIISLAFGADAFIGPFGYYRTETKDLSIQQRIYNGDMAKKGQFPYIVYLSITLNNGSLYMCGGSIIDNSWILTAAHCTDNVSYIEIFYGTTKKFKGKFSHTVGADNITQHNGYNNISLEHDVALIHTPHVKFSKLVNKVELADGDNDYEGSWAVASGWGRTSDDGDSPEDLQFADLQILSEHECWKVIGRKSDNILCVDTSDGKTVGSGDSGGPLVTHGDHKLVGVSSFTIRRVSPLPACFSRVSVHRDWIREHTGIE